MVSEPNMAIDTADRAMDVRAEHAEFLKGLGATDVVDYTVHSLWDVLPADSADVVYDNFGAPSDVFVGEDNITDDTNQSVIDDESASRSTIYEDYNSAEFKDNFGIYSFEKF